MSKYIHMYTWSCSLHTGGAYQIRHVTLQTNEEWEPCACVNTSYIPVADFTVTRRVKWFFYDEICDRLNITFEQFTKLLIGEIAKQKYFSTWNMAKIIAKTVQRVATGKLEV